MSRTFALTFFPLVSALLYAVGALLLKRSNDHGPGIWRTTFVVNMIVATLFSTLWLAGGPPVQTSLLWQPLIVAFCLFFGQLLQFLALDRGDVSVAVPVFGLKVVLVAFFTPVIIGEGVGLKLWLAACLSALGIAFINRKDRDKPPRHLGITLLAGGSCSVCFALFDVFVQRWGPQWGFGRLLPTVFGMNAILSLSLIFMFRAPLRSISRAAWPWLVSGAVLFGTQSILFTSTVSIYGRATAANVLYSSRGLLSVVLVWCIGHWFANEERHLGFKVLRWRLLGATLMLAAIGLVMV